MQCSIKKWLQGGNSVIKGSSFISVLQSLRINVLRDISTNANIRQRSFLRVIFGWLAIPSFLFHRQIIVY